MTQPSGTDFTPLHNPYIVGNPIKDAKMFFGREEDFAYIKKSLSGSEQGGLIVLCGARRSGKTSVLFQIQDGRLGDDFIPVLIDMQSMAIGSDRDFLDKLARAIIGAGAVPSLALIEEFVVDKSDSPYAAFEKLIERITGHLAGRKLVLTFDEYELFETNIESGVITVRVLHLLANMIEHHNVFAVFTGSDNLEERDRDYWSLFLSKARQKRISFLHHRDTIRLITEPLRDEVTFEEGVADEIASLTAGQPFYTQVLCRSIVDLLNDERRRVITSEDVGHVVDEVVENPLPQMIFHWNALSDIDKLVLSIIAELNRTEERPVGAADIVGFAEEESVGYRFDPAALNKSLEVLFHGDLIVKEPATDLYSFKMGLWRRWVTRMHSVWQVVDELDRAGGPSAESGLVAVGSGATGARAKRFYAVSALVVVAAAVVAIGFGGRWGRNGQSAAPAGPRLTSTVTVETEPPDATVLFDGHPAGIAPFSLQVPPGSLLVTTRLHNYESHEEWVVVAENDSAMLDVTLVPLRGILRVTSEPNGADIFVDGTATGERTPTDLALAVTQPHQIELRLAKFVPRNFTDVRVSADSTTTRHHNFALPTAILRIDSEPMGARVEIDGRDTGERTPLTKVGVTHGEHRVKLGLDGYADSVRTVEVSGSETRVATTLRKLPQGMLVFQILGGGDIEVDGVLKAERKEFWPLHLDAGKHVIRIRHRSGKVWEETVTVRSAESDTLRYEL